MNEISNRIVKTELVEWKKLEWLQSPNLKEMTQGAFERLKTSLRNNSFVMPFNCWQQDGKTWILDGHHRERALRELENEGCAIPNTLPANFIDCKDRREAVKLLLVYSSIYANVTDEGLYEMMSLENLSLDDLKAEVDLPSIDWVNFEEGYFKGFSPGTEDEQGKLDQKKPIKCPECGAEFIPKS